MMGDYLKLKKGINLIQPWAMKVVEGKLPVLVRSINTHCRGRVAVIATSTFDGKYLVSHIDTDFEKDFEYNSAIGSVELLDSIKVKHKDIMRQMKKLVGRKFAENYPKHFIPFVDSEHFLFIWILRNPKKWKKPIKIKKRLGIRWTSINIEDE